MPTNNEDNSKMVIENVDHVEQDNSFKNMTMADKDKAIELLKQTGRSVTLTPENNKTVLRKIDLRVLPVILAIYFLQALDKVSMQDAFLGKLNIRLTLFFPGNFSICQCVRPRQRCQPCGP